MTNGPAHAILLSDVVAATTHISTKKGNLYGKDEPTPEEEGDTELDEFCRLVRGRDAGGHRRFVELGDASGQDRPARLHPEDPHRDRLCGGHDRAAPHRHRARNEARLNRGRGRERAGLSVSSHGRTGTHHHSGHGSSL